MDDVKGDHQSLNFEVFHSKYGVCMFIITFVLIVLLEKTKDRSSSKSASKFFLNASSRSKDNVTL